MQSKWSFWWFRWYQYDTVLQRHFEARSPFAATDVDVVWPLCMCIYTFIMSLCVHSRFTARATEQRMSTIYFHASCFFTNVVIICLPYCVLHCHINHHANPRVQTTVPVMCLNKLAWQIVVPQPDDNLSNGFLSWPYMPCTMAWMRHSAEEFMQHYV